MEIRKLNYEEFEGKRYTAIIKSDRYLDIEPCGEGFSIEWKMTEKELSKTLTDDMLSDWLEDPVAFGAYEGDILVGFVEGFLERWNNRFRISNICVFDNDKRKNGVGTALIEVIMKEAVKSGARMAVLETQSYNYKAISFYQKNGFEIIGFDRFAYSNTDPVEHNMRIEMGKKL